MIGFIGGIFVIFLLTLGGITFSISLSMLINLYVFKFLEKHLKSFYFYFCNIICFIITGVIISLIWKLDSILILVLESMLLFGVTIGTNEKLLNKYYLENKKYDKDGEFSKLIKNNADSCYLRKIIVWTFYVIAVIINSLLKLNIITIDDKELVFVFESTECSAIILLAITTLLEMVKKKKNINNSIEKSDKGE